MTENWKPGDPDVAQIAWTSTSKRHGGNSLALRCSDEPDESHWRTQAFGIIPDGWVTDTRRLVVIDPEDREQVERLYALMWRPERGEVPPTGDDPIFDEDVTDLTAALREFANPTPPRYKEPSGWGAVVEDKTGAYWTLYAPEAGVWINYVEGKRRWHEIFPVRIVGEGVTP